jgi:16S rRNA (uracil1498-N3)-methyltransferase
MTIRLFVPQPLVDGAEIALPDAAARHAQVRRVQPGEPLQLFDGEGREWRATLAVGVPANERMDVLVEKAAELGVAAIQPLQCARSVVRLDGERAQRRQQHWQGVAVAACEQSGRATVPLVAPMRALDEWLLTAGWSGRAWLLSTRADAPPLALLGSGAMDRVVALSGPEGGLTPLEEQAACDAGFERVSLGPRILRADTAPLALLAWLGLRG